MTDRDNIPAWARKIDFVWLFPLMTPFAIYGYVRLFFAVVGFEIAPDVKQGIAVSSLLIGVGGGVFAVLVLKVGDVKWTWLARDTTEAKGDEG